jgi:hypothetical protein
MDLWFIALDNLKTHFQYRNIHMDENYLQKFTKNNRYMET